MQTVMVVEYMYGQHVQDSPFVLHVAPRDYDALKDPIQKIDDQEYCPRCITFADNGAL